MHCYDVKEDNKLIQRYLYIYIFVQYHKKEDTKLK